MVLACVLICCEAGKFTTVVKAVKKIDGVKKAFTVLGRWDIVARVQAADLKALSNIMLKINGLPGVKSTETLVQVAL